MRFYRFMNGLGWPGSYLGKILLVSFLGVHVPMIGAVLYTVLASELPLVEVQGILIALLVATLLGTGATMASIFALLAPVRAAAKAINHYLSDRRVPALPTRMRDEAGVLMANVQEGVTRLDTALDAARAQRDEANREKQQAFEMLSGMSHELRTPLNHIIGFAEIMSNETLGPLGQEMYRGYANDIGSSGGQLLGVLQSVLELSEIEAGKVEAVHEQVSLRAAVDQAVHLQHMHAQGAGVELSQGAPVELGVQADPRAVKQMLVGLLGLAIENAPAGGLVGISLQREADRAVVTVADGGRAWGPDDLPPELRGAAASAAGAPNSGGIDSVSPTAVRLAVICSLARLQGASVTLDQSHGGRRVMLSFRQSGLREAPLAA